MLTLVTFSCIVVGILAASTTPHMHHESNENENFSFGYESHTQALVVRSTATCFIFELTADEKSSIHTNDGMTAVEMRAIKEIDSAYYTVIPGVLLNPNLLKVCKLNSHHATNLRYAIVH